GCVFRWPRSSGYTAVDSRPGHSPYQLDQLLHRGNFRPSIGGVIPANLAHCSSCFAPSHPSPALAHSVPSGTENDELFQQHDFRCTLPTPGGSARDGGADDSGTGDGATNVGRRGRLLLPSAPGPPTVGALESFMASRLDGAQGWGGLLVSL